MTDCGQKLVALLAAEANTDEPNECNTGHTSGDNGLPLIEGLAADKNVQTLSGYLLKLSSRGPLRAMKKRWFVFNETNCTLYYYRTRDDLVPLGEIDIRRATFTIKTATIFTIISTNKEVTLEANDAQQCLQWLTRLQALRKKYIIGLANRFGVKLTINHINHDLMDNKNDSVDSDPSRSVFYCDSRDNQMTESTESSHSLFKHWNHSTTSKDITDSPATKHKIFGGIVSKMKTKNMDIPSGQRTKSDSISSPIRTFLKFSDKNSESICCAKCRQSEEQMVSLSDDLSAVEIELQASREVIRLLKKQLEIVTNEKNLLEDICKNGANFSANDLLTKLSQNNEEMTELRIKLRATEANEESLRSQNESLKKEMTKLNEELSVLQEMLKCRDEMYVSLTHQIFMLESEKGETFSPQISRSESNDSSTAATIPKLIKVQTNELESLRDTVRAYETQNEFLNREIVELNELRAIADKESHHKNERISELEAKCCQIQSKLLSLLKEINQSSQSPIDPNDKLKPKNPVVADTCPPNTVQALVNRLLEDISLDIPLSWKPGNKNRNSELVSSKSHLYDDLGFYYKNEDFESVSDDLDVFATKDESNSRGDDQQSRDRHNSRDSDSKAKALWKSKWDSFVGNLNNHELQRTQELKAMLRTGIPQEYRCKIWRCIIYMRCKHKMAQCGHNYYTSLHKQNQSPAAKSLDPSAKQIELDLLRTLPQNKHFESLESDGTARLRRVLTAFSRHNQGVGYCQGLNRLAAVALLFMPEEDAFWCLVAIVETIMPNDYFGRNLLGAHVDQYVLRHLLSEKLPKLYQHLEQQGIELSLFSWFLTAFVDNIPVDVYLRIWDVFLYEGNKVLFRFALSFLKLHEEVILRMADSVAINQFLRTLGERHIDVRLLCYIAFCELNPFPYRTVKLKRQHYSQLVSNELQKLEEIRNSLPNHDSFECESD